MDLVTSIIEIVSTLIVGGTITTFITLRYTRKKAKEEAKQSEAQTLNDVVTSAQKAASDQIDHANKVVEMYKKTVEDLTELNERTELLLKQKIGDLEKEIRELKKMNESQSEIIDTQSKQIKDLQDVIENLKLEIEKIRKESDRNCDFCAFSDGCKKKIALMKSKTKPTKKKK